MPSRKIATNIFAIKKFLAKKVSIKIFSSNFLTKTEFRKTKVWKNIFWLSLHCLLNFYLSGWAMRYLLHQKKQKQAIVFFLLSLNLPKEAVITIEHIIDYDISLFWVFYPNLTERPKIKKPSFQHDISNWVKQNVSPYFLFIEIGNFDNFFCFFHQPWYVCIIRR